MKARVPSLAAATSAGWLVLAGVVVFLLARVLRRKPIVATPLLPPPPPAGPGTPPEPSQASDPTGIAAGALISTLRASIIEPPSGGKVYRGAFSSNFKVTMEIVNQATQAAPADVEVVCDFEEYAGARRPGIRTRLPRMTVRAQEVLRLDGVAIDSGNWNNVVADFAQGIALVHVWTNGKLTQSTSFEVW